MKIAVLNILQKYRKTSMVDSYFNNIAEMFATSIVFHHGYVPGFFSKFPEQLFCKIPVNICFCIW